MDCVALEAGNRMLGNAPSAAGIEVQVLPCRIRFLQDMAFALTGGDSGADLDGAAAQWRARTGAEVSAPQSLPEHGVRVVFVVAENGKIELLEPLDDSSPIAAFLARNPDGGMHHICFDVDDLYASRDRLIDSGARILGSHEPKIGAHGKPVLFIHPKDMTGTLVELQQA